MKKTSVVIDDSLLEQVQDLLGTRSIRDTIDTALREIVRNEARRQEIAALSEMDGLDLANEEIMVRAWRS
jgi:Arc/MetJ family transcription regulator